MKISKFVKSRNGWTAVVVVCTFFITVFLSWFNKYTYNNSVLVSFCILAVLLIISILFDGVAVAVTTTNEKSIIEATKHYNKKINTISLFLVNNAEKVCNICADVVGDICSIVTGSCVTVIAVRLTSVASNISEFVIGMILSAIVASITIGGKAYGKFVAVNCPNDCIILIAKILSKFIKEKK